MNGANEAIRAFVPTEILSWLGPTLDDEVPSQRVEAVALFCDISSFTTIANRLIDEGREGLSTLRTALNSTFDSWITSIHAHGGSVAQFIGDAITAVWRIEKASDYDAAIRSARAAAESIIRSGSGALSVAGVDVRGTCGIGVGSLDIMSISLDDSQRELVVDGDALRRATSASAIGQPGAVELSDGRTVGFGESEPSHHEITAEVTESHVPRPIRDRLAAGHSEWLGELRLISIMFVGLPQARDAESVQRAVSLITGSVESHEDQLIKINVDDKGLVMMFVYGAPTSHDDDPVRAVSASLAASEALRTAEIEHSIGLSSGRAFCGAIGNQIRREYNITGHVANLANRLMALRDGVLVDRATADMAGPRFVLQGSQMNELKGIAEPVEAGHPEAATATAEQDWAAMVGRSVERKAVHELLDGAFQTLVIEGEAGMGKSSIARYAASSALNDDWLVIEGSASVAGERQPYGVWQRALKASFGQSAIVEAARNLAAADQWFADRHPLTEVLTQEELEDTVLTREMTGRVRAENTSDVLLRLLEALIGGRTTLLILEDAQWFDSASWAFLKAVAQKGSIDRIVLNLRPIEGPQPVELAQIEAARSTQQVLLGDLDRDDIEALLKARFDVDVVPPEVVEKMAESGAGNPLFAEQLAFALVDAGQIEIQGRALRVANSDFEQSVLLTDTLESILTSRIDQAPQPAQLTLKVASVIGREFALRPLEAVHPVSQHEAVAADSVVLAEMRLVRLVHQPPDTSYEFWHRLTRDVAYQLLPDNERVVLHERIARWFEQNDRSVGSSVLAHHYLAAQQWTTAAIYLDSAASEARDTQSNIEAVRQLRTLNELAADGRAPARPSDIARWLRYEGDALLALGRYVEARLRYKEALGLWGNKFADGRIRQAGGAVSAFGSLLVGPSQIEDPERNEAATESALILPFISQMAYFNQNVLELVYSNLKAVRFAEKSGDPVSLARAHGAWAIAASVSGMHRLSRRSDRRALEEAERDGGVQTVAYANLLHAILHYARGHWDEAEQGFEQALISYRLISATADLDTTLSAYAFLGLFQGDAEGLFARFDEISASPSNQVALWAAAGRTIGQVMTGQSVSDQLLAELQRTLHEPRLEKGDALLGFGVIAMVAARRRNEEQLDAALNALKRWLVGLPATSPYPGFGLYGTVLAGFAVAADPIDGWGRRAARRLARRSLRHLRVVGFQNPVIRPLAHLGAAEAARTSIGRRRHERRAAKLADRLGTAYTEPLRQFAAGFATATPSTHPAKEALEK